MTIVPQNIKMTALASSLKQGADPAAGAQASITVPTGKKWIVRSFKVALATNATVANRRVQVQIVIGGVEVFNAVCETVQTASLTLNYVAGAFGHDKPQQDGLQFINCPLFPITLPAGSIIRTFTSNMQAGDDFGIPSCVVDEFDV